ncbi:hypothetical protein HYU12_02630 [Candidatus Woesearchaeota archaeon]|nr:hypothetical protein [Candidatus Woesearchaeota archaeon]
MEISGQEGVLYLIRLNGEAGAERLSVLESLLGRDERVSVRNVVAPIGAVIAILYGDGVAEELAGMGYEVVRQEKIYRAL